MSKMQIRSAYFPNAYLRIDGTDVTHPIATGGGIVNCQFGAGPRETQKIVANPDGTVSIESTAFPNVFLRLDGSGKVNCQHTAGPYEKFRFEPQVDGSVAIASVQFPGLYLRMNGSTVTSFSESGGGTVYARFTAGPYERFIVENVEEEPGDNQLRTFFIRNKGENGLVLGFAPTGTTAMPQPMLAHRRATQLFKCVPVSRDGKFVLFVNQATQLALQAEVDGTVRFAHTNRALPSQQWAFNAKNQIVNAFQGTKVLCVQDGKLVFSNPDSSSAAQKFEMFYPSDFVYVRNCWTGRFLTASADDTVSWGILNPCRDDDQQWGLTADGLLVSRGRGKVLQLASSRPVPGAPLVLADQKPLGVGNANQRFDFTSIDGTLRCRANNAFVIGKSDSKAVSVAYSIQDQTQLVEFISPLQYFSIQSQAISNDSKYWISRSGNNVRMAATNTGATEQLLTLTRYGEIMSPADGYIVQSQGDKAPPQFVDSASEPIGSNKTSFTYQSGNKARLKDTGAICLREDTLGFMELGGRQPQTIMYAAITYPVSGNQAWSLVGRRDSLFDTYQDIASAYFSDPARLPSETIAETTIPVVELAADNEISKTTKVIVTIVTGLLGMVGIDVASVTPTAAKNVAQIVLEEVTLAAKIAVIMQGTMTASSIISIADGITRAGLWLKLIKLVLPSSFWSCALAAIKLSFTITGFAQGVSWAIKGAKILEIVTEVAIIVETEGPTLVEPRVRRYG